MDKLKEFIDLYSSRKEIWDEIAPLEIKAKGLTSKIDEVNKDLSFSLEKGFLTQKLWDAFTEEQKNTVIKEREKYKNLALNTSCSYAANSPFDPFYDSWYLVAAERDGDKVRFQVSCRKNEGSISGLMTFLDTYWTTWFDIKELDKEPEFLKL